MQQKQRIVGVSRTKASPYYGSDDANAGSYAQAGRIREARKKGNPKRNGVQKRPGIALMRAWKKTPQSVPAL